jgi:DNA-binding transcriptional regulator YhcF (GntR family)
MLIRVDPDSPLGLAEQIADQVRAAVASGEVQPGGKLPAARDLAAGLDVNMHTVLRAYGLLRDEGLIDLRRGRGAHVVPQPAQPLAAQLRRQVRDLVLQAERLGVDREQLIHEIREVNP